MTAIQAGRVEYDGRVHIQRASVPLVEVTKALAERTATAFHGILERTEPLSISFRKSRVDFNGGFFQRGYDRLYLKIEESFVEEAGTSPDERRYISWQQPERKTPSGFLTFSLSKETWRYPEATRWKEGKKSSLQKVLARTVAEIRRYFAEARRRRAKEAIERKKHDLEMQRLHQEYRRNEAIRQQKEAEQKHTDSLMLVGRTRTENLFKAAELWHRYRLTDKFIAACEIHWRVVGIS